MLWNTTVNNDDLGMGCIRCLSNDARSRPRYALISATRGMTEDGNDRRLNISTPETKGLYNIPGGTLNII